MGGCPNVSGMTPFVLRSPRVIGAAVIAPIPFAVTIDLEFDAPMNTALVPGDVNVEIVNLIIPAWLEFASWTDATHARYLYAGAWPPATSTVQLKVLDPDLQSAEGAECFTSGIFQLLP